MVKNDSYLKKRVHRHVSPVNVIPTVSVIPTVNVISTVNVILFLTVNVILFLTVNVILFNPKCNTSDQP